MTTTEVTITTDDLERSVVEYVPGAVIVRMPRCSLRFVGHDMGTVVETWWNVWRVTLATQLSEMERRERGL